MSRKIDKLCRALKLSAVSLALASTACSTLTVVAAGPGKVTVTDERGSHTCAGVCTYQYKTWRAPVSVTLSALPYRASRFGFWWGVCDENRTRPDCNVQVSGDMTVYGIFPDIPR